MSKRNYSNLSKKDLQNVLRSTNANIIKTFCETGSVDRKKFMKRKIIIHETNQRRKRHRQSPHISLRQFTREASISVSSVFRMVHVEKFHPFHLSVHQALDGRDFGNRLNFYQ